MHYRNPAVTDAGHTTMVHALRHEWEADDLDEQGRLDVMATAMGGVTLPSAPVRTWTDLSDDELRARLGARVTSSENAQNLQGILVHERDDPAFADLIDELLERPAR